jgi:hypothetical protein
MDWAVRQLPNRGRIREGVMRDYAMLVALSCFDDDLAGAVKLAPRALVESVLDEGFEGGGPPDIGATGLTHAIDPARAHSGQASLRLTPDAGADYNVVYFDLDHRMDFNADGEFSVWVYAGPGAKVQAYVSAQVSGKSRHSIADLTGAVEPGQWRRLSGKVPAAKWSMDEHAVRFIVRAHGPCWIDDATLRAVRPSAKTNPAKPAK